MIENFSFRVHIGCHVYNLADEIYTRMEMKELCRTNDVVMLSFLEFRLREHKIRHVVLDANMSIMEGSVGILPRRVLVDSGQMPKAREVLLEAENP